jgi:formyl-CoA transferase
MGFPLLDGVRVLDLGRGHAGPYCAKLLADAGADVIHVERPGAGDPTRAAGPFAPEDSAHAFSASFAFLNAGKRSATLDYSRPSGAQLLRELLAETDILVENGRPGTLERHGLGPESLRAINPALVHVSISSYGLSGPYRDLPASEMTLQAAAGLMDGNGDLGRPPLRYPMNLAQHWAGANAAYTGLIAYWQALLSGEGQQVEVSIQESLATSWWSVWADYQYTGCLQARGQTAELLPAADGMMMLRWQTSVPWEEYAIAMDALELVTDPDLQPPTGLMRNFGRVHDILSTHTPSRTRRAWMDTAIAYQLPAGILQSLDEVARCEQHEARGFWDRVGTPWGAEVRFPGRFSVIDGEAPGGRLRVVPRLGEHNEQIYGERLGRTPAELERLRSEGAI